MNKIIVTALCFLNIYAKEASEKENIYQNFNKAISTAYDVARELNQFPGIDNSALKIALENSSSMKAETSTVTHEQDLQSKVASRSTFINGLINQVKKNQKLRDISVILFSLLQLYKKDLIESLLRISDSIFLEIEDALLSETIKQLRVKAISVSDENTKTFLKQTRFVLQPKKGAYILSLLKKTESIISIQKSIQALIPLAENISAKENETSLLMPSEELANLSQVFYSKTLKIRSELPSEESFRQADDLLEEILAINPEANKLFNKNNLKKDESDETEDALEAQTSPFLEKNKEDLSAEEHDDYFTEEATVQAPEVDEEVESDTTDELNQTFVIKTNHKQTQVRPKKATKTPVVKKRIQPTKKNVLKKPSQVVHEINDAPSEDLTQESYENPSSEEGPIEEVVAEEQESQESRSEQVDAVNPSTKRVTLYQAQQAFYQNESPRHEQESLHEQNEQDDEELVEEERLLPEETPAEEKKPNNPIKPQEPPVQHPQAKELEEEESEEYLTDQSEEHELPDKQHPAQLEQQAKEPIKELLPATQKENTVVPKKNQQDKNTHAPEKATSQEKTASDKKKEEEAKKEQERKIALEKSIKEKLANLKTQNKPILAVEPKKLDENLKTEPKAEDQQEKLTIAVAPDLNTKTQEPIHSTPAQETKIEPAQESLKKPEPIDPQVKTQVAQEALQTVETQKLDKNQAIVEEKTKAPEEQKPLAKTKIQSIKDKIKKLVKKISPDSKKNDQPSQAVIKALEPEAIAIKKTEATAKNTGPEEGIADDQEEALPAEKDAEATSPNQNQEPATEGSLEGQVDETEEEHTVETQEESILKNEQEPKKKKTVKQKLSGLFKKIKETVSKK